MVISARNQLKGTVSTIIEGAVNNEITLTLADGEKLTTVITKHSSEALKLAEGKSAVAIIKAPWVILADPNCGLNFSARNQFNGKITHITEGAVNSTVKLVTDKNLTLTAIVTNESVKEMNLKVGIETIALIKASSIILATEK